MYPLKYSWSFLIVSFFRIFFNSHYFFKHFRHTYVVLCFLYFRYLYFKCIILQSLLIRVGYCVSSCFLDLIMSYLVELLIWETLGPDSSLFLPGPGSSTDLETELFISFLGFRFHSRKVCYNSYPRTEWEKKSGCKLLGKELLLLPLKSSRHRLFLFVSLG